MNWDHAPLQRQRQEDRVSLCRVPAGASWRVVATATRFACRHQHWVDGRTLPCLLPESPCPFCERGLGKFFAAFLGCYNLSRQAPMVLALPEDAYRATEEIVGTDLLGGLRGWRLEFSRPGSSRRGKICVAGLGQEPDPASIPAKLHVPHILYRCWGIGRESYKRAAESSVNTSVV